MKYTQEQVRQMAKEFAEAMRADTNDIRCKEVLVRLLMQHGFPPEHSWANIQHLARMAS